jgi:hypothetical protein
MDHRHGRLAGAVTLDDVLERDGCHNSISLNRSKEGGCGSGLLDADDVSLREYISRRG